MTLIEELERLIEILQINQPVDIETHYNVTERLIEIIIEIQKQTKHD